MFCCRDYIEKQKSCCKGMIIGGVLTLASVGLATIIKKIKYKKNIENQDTCKECNLNKDLEREEMELREKIDEFNSRRLTLENESKKA